MSDTDDSEEKLQEITRPIVNKTTPYWVCMIQDLMEIADYSPLKIAYYLQLPPGYLQKLLANPSQYPLRPCVRRRLIRLHLKVFRRFWV